MALVPVVLSPRWPSWVRSSCTLSCCIAMNSHRDKEFYVFYYFYLWSLKSKASLRRGNKRGCNNLKRRRFSKKSAQHDRLSAGFGLFIFEWARVAERHPPITFRRDVIYHICTEIRCVLALSEL